MYRDAKLLANDANLLTAGATLGQRQDSLAEQLDDLVIVAERLGLHDAAQVVRRLSHPSSVPSDAQLRELPFSEVCMHMKVAGKLMWVHPLPHQNAAQLYDLDGRRFSAPITMGEAGL